MRPPKSAFRSTTTISRPTSGRTVPPSTSRSPVPNAERTSLLATTLARSSLKLLANQRLERAVAAELSAAEAYDAAALDLSNYTAANGASDPSTEFLAAVSLRDALARELTTNSELTEAARAELDSRIAGLEDQITVLQPQKTEYDRLNRSVTRTQQLLDEATGERVLAEAFSRLDPSTSAIVASPTAEASRIPSVVPPGLFAAASFSLLGYLLLRFGPKQRPAAPRSGASSSAPRARMAVPEIRTSNAPEPTPAVVQPPPRERVSTIRAEDPDHAEIGSDDDGVDHGPRARRRTGRSSTRAVRRPARDQHRPGTAAHRPTRSPEAALRPQPTADRSGPASLHRPTTARRGGAPRRATKARRVRPTSRTPTTTATPALRSRIAPTLDSSRLAPAIDHPGRALRNRDDRGIVRPVPGGRPHDRAPSPPRRQVLASSGRRARLHDGPGRAPTVSMRHRRVLLDGRRSQRAGDLCVGLRPERGADVPSPPGLAARTRTLANMIWSRAARANFDRVLRGLRTGRRPRAQHLPPAEPVDPVGGSTTATSRSS